jgi:DNA-binding LacI/PurR family transcriptional regulator
MQARGVFLISTPQSDEAVAAFAKALPCVFLGRQLPGMDVSAVSSDDEKASMRAVRHLVELGHRRIAHIEGGDKSGALERKMGYRRMMEEMDLSVIEVPGAHDIDSGRRGVELLLEGADAPTAIFADNDLTAIGVINELNRRGIRVPQDMSVVGYDDIPASGTETISLTTLRQDPQAHAIAAVELLNSMLAEPAIRNGSRIIPSELIVRRSTDSRHP